MSKKLVEEAFERVASGDYEAARRLADRLRIASPGYLERRLATLADDPARAPMVEALREVLAGRQPSSVVVPHRSTTPPSSSVTPSHLVVRLPAEMTLADPSPALRALATPEPCDFRFDDCRFTSMWALVGIATRARDTDSVRVSGLVASSAGRFAHAVGLTDATAGRSVDSPAQPERTYRLTRFRDLTKVERDSAAIARLMLPDGTDDEVRKTLQYVLVELFRNVIQHSEDPLGGVVGAQLMEHGELGRPPVVQVAVGDSGIGIPRALSSFHPGFEEPRAALAKALEPHISGTFEEGRTGSRYNAGMGLFFISEVAKLTAGRLMIATRDAAMFLAGDPEFDGNHEHRFLKPDGVGFPGTLVAFELPLGHVEEHDALIGTIRDRATERTPPRDVTRILRFDEAPEGPPKFLVRLLAENAVAAEELARERLLPLVQAGRGFALDFRGMEICTQSFLHALLFRPLRYAWAEGVPVFALNVEPAVLVGLQLVEGYSLKG